MLKAGVPLIALSALNTKNIARFCETAVRMEVSTNRDRQMIMTHLLPYMAPKGEINIVEIAIEKLYTALEMLITVPVVWNSSAMMETAGKKDIELKGERKHESDTMNTMSFFLEGEHNE